MVTKKNQLNAKKLVLVKQETPYSKVIFERQDINDGVVEYVERWEDAPAAFDVLTPEQYYQRVVTFVQRLNYRPISVEMD